MHLQYNAETARGAARRFVMQRKDANPSFTELKAGIDAMQTAFTEFKKTNDAAIAELKSKGTVDPATTDKLAKLEAELLKVEPINAKFTAAEAARVNAERDLKEAKDRLDKIELRFGRPGTGGSTAEERKEVLNARVNVWMRGVTRRIVEMPLEDVHRKEFTDIEAEYKALGISNDTTGGYLAPLEYVKEIIKALTEISPVRPLVRVRRTGSKGIEIPKRTGTFAARRVIDQGTRTETDGLRWGMIEIPAPEMYALVDISNQNLEDSAFDLEQEVKDEALEQFNVREGYEFVSGTGNGEMEGILVNADVGYTASGTSALISDTDGQADGILKLKYDIKTAYARNATWIANRTTIGQIRRLKDAEKNYIWQPGGLGLGKPATIDGDPYMEMPDMPNAGANTYPIAYGDFYRAYTLVDRLAMQTMKDPFTQATGGNIRFMFRRRVGGRVVLAEAIRKLKCATS